MKFLIFLFLTSISALAQDPLRLPSAQELHFVDFTFESKRVNEVVVTLNEAGKSRLAELKADDFSCEYKGRETYLCWKVYQENLVMDEELKHEVTTYFQEQKIRFFALEGDPSETVKGESYLEFLIPQKVLVNGFEYANYRYAILDGSLHKLVFGIPAKTGLVALGQGVYELVFSHRRQISKSKFEQYLFFGKYR